MIGHRAETLRKQVARMPIFDLPSSRSPGLCVLACVSQKLAEDDAGMADGLQLDMLPKGARRSESVSAAAMPSTPPPIAREKSEAELSSTPRGVAYLENLLISSVINTTGLSVQESKPALSVQLMTIQFRRFVEKAGPVFRVQDTVERILTGEDPVVTVFVGAVYAFICIYPLTLLLVPNIALITILVTTHSIRKPRLLRDDTPASNSTASTPLLTADGPTGPPVEGGIDYVGNLQDIQVMMGRVADLTDAGRMVVPFVDWSSPRVSLVLLQILVVTTIPLALALPYLPLRAIALVGGLGGLAAAHPVSIALLTQLASTPAAKASTTKLWAWLQTTIRNDALEDDALDLREHELREVEVFENERKGPDGWSPNALTVRDPPPWSGAGIERTGLGEASLHEPSIRIQPPAGFAWVDGDGWAVDHLGDKGHELDGAGWLYFENGSRRRRRWIRRVRRIL